MKELTAFIFPGQGSQFVGMGKTLYDEYNTAREVFEQANDILNFDLKKLCFEGSVLELNKMENMFPALLTASVAAFRVYMEEMGVTPTFSAGHSLGEYSALTCAGAISFPDALKIVRERALLSEDILKEGTGSMSIINGVQDHIVEEECRRISTRYRFAGVSCFNAPDQVAISGHSDAVMKVEDRIMELDGQATPLLMSAPFHCPLMRPAAEKLMTELSKYSFSPFKWPVISNVFAQPYRNTNDLVKNLSLQLVRPVRWKETLYFLKRKGVTTIIEMGPQAVQTNLIKSNLEGIKAISFGQSDDRKALLAKLPAEARPDGTGRRHSPGLITKCLAAAVCTPNNNWDEAECRKGIDQPYDRLQELKEQAEKDGGTATVEQMKEALSMLSTILQTKKVSQDEQARLFCRITDETGTGDLLSGLKPLSA